MLREVQENRSTVGAPDRVDRVLLKLAWISFCRIVDCKLADKVTGAISFKSLISKCFVSIVSHLAPVVEPAGAVFTETLLQLNEAMKLVLICFKLL